MTPTTIELQPNHTAFILDEKGELIEFYMPDNPKDVEVPSKIVEILNILINERV